MKLFYNAVFYGPDWRQYTALVSKDGLIVELLEQIPDNFTGEKIDLQGAWVLPAFCDTHTHSFEGGLYSLGCDLSEVKTTNELLEKIAAARPVGGVVFAWNFDENQLPEKRFPTAAELEAVHPGVPVALRRVDGHSCVLSTTALKLAQPKHNEGGLCRGADNDHAMHYFHAGVTPEGVLAAYEQAQKLAFAEGFGCVHTMIGDADQNPLHYALLRDNLSRFKLDWVLYPQMFNIEAALELGAERIGGCILADGSFGSHTAALLQPYTDQPDCMGLLYKSRDYWHDFIARAHRHNLAVCVHAIGDAAVDAVLSGMEAAQQADPKQLKHEIIHAELLPPSAPERLKAAGITCVMQPMFDHLWGGDNQFYSKVLGQKRALNTNRLGDLHWAGVAVTGSSDWYITPLNARLGVNAAVNMHNPQQRLSRKDALELYTINAALLSNDAHKRGSLAPGRQTDLVCLSGDPLTANMELVRVLATYKRSEKVF